MEVTADAEQVTSYGMAALRYRKKPLVGFAAAKDQLSIFPFSPEVVDAVRDRLHGFKLRGAWSSSRLTHPCPTMWFATWSL